MWPLVAPVVRWPLRSPLRLVGTAAALVLTLALTSQCTSTPSPPQATTTSAASPSPTSTPTPKRTNMADRPDPDAPVETKFDINPVPGAEQVVVLAAAPVSVAYVQEWGHPERTREEWLAAMAPLVTTRYYDQLRTVDPTSTFPLTVTGDVVEQAFFDGDSATFAVPVSADGWARGVSVGLRNAPNGTWLVDYAEPIW